MNNIWVLLHLTCCVFSPFGNDSVFQSTQIFGRGRNQQLVFFLDMKNIPLVGLGHETSTVMLQKSEGINDGVSPG